MKRTGQSLILQNHISPPDKSSLPVSRSDSTSTRPLSPAPLPDSASSTAPAPETPAAQDKYAVLKAVFGYDAFRPGQAAIIDALTAGRDVLAIMPTGGGKSLCYQIPALMAPGLTIVISPLIALMNDQVATLKCRGVPAEAFHSSLPYAERQRIRRRAFAGHLKLLYVSPEGFLGQTLHALLADLPVSIICLDEAHCLSGWGRSFRPSYRKLGRAIAALPHRPVICAFTASAVPAVRRDLLHTLALQDPYISTGGFDRPNLFFSVLMPPDRLTALKHLLRERTGKCGIVYCLTRRAVDDLTFSLKNEGFEVLSYHAGLTKDEREQARIAWTEGKCPVMIATNAFGMGIDKGDVRFVIHYNMPADPENYYQEAGRAGRDGQEAECILLSGPWDIKIHDNLIDGTERVLSKRRRMEQQARREKRRAKLNEMPLLFRRRAVNQSATGHHSIEDFHCPAPYADPPGNSLLTSENGASPAAHHPGKPRHQPSLSEAQATALTLRSPLKKPDYRYLKELTDKLNYMRWYTAGTVCLRHALISYFGDEAPAYCGKCSVCLETARRAPHFHTAVPPHRSLFRAGKQVRHYQRVGDSNAQPVGDSIAQPHGNRQKSRYTAAYRSAASRPSRGFRFGHKKPDSRLVRHDCPENDSQDELLYGHLKSMRARMARRFGVEPQRIFSNDDLKKMALSKPATFFQMLTLHGVDHLRVVLFGAIFLKDIRLWLLARYGES
ncbi:MAG: ATP-dependent DNA helicase RecQ [Lachnospiraceae bacterium]|nr:ATP-dependent DNA helicase RecQ [Lachnospiraceae bacterium]